MQMSSTDINHHVGAMLRVPSSSSSLSSLLSSPASASLHNKDYCNREVSPLIPYPPGSMVNAVNSCFYDTSNNNNASLVDHMQQQQLHHFSANLHFLYSHSNIPAAATEHRKAVNQNVLYQSILQRQQATEESSCNELQEADDADVDHMTTKQLFPLKPDCEEKSDDHPSTSTTVNTSSNSVNKNNNAAMNMNMNSNMNRSSLDCLNAGSSGANLSNLQPLPWLHPGLQSLPPPHNIVIPTMNPLSSILNTVQHVKKSRRGPRSRSSQYRGVTFYRRTGRWESHIWDCGRQVYLGGFDTAHDAARAYDKAAIKFRGFDADINFSLSHYENDIKLMSSVTKEELVQILRRQSTLISHGNSRVRGMLLHKCGRFGRKITQFSPKGVYDQSDPNQGVEKSPANPADGPNQELLQPRNQVNEQNLELSLGTTLSTTEGNSKSEEAGKVSMWYSSPMVFGGQDILKSCVPTKVCYHKQDSLNKLGKVHDGNEHHDGPSDDKKQPLEHAMLWGKRSLLSSQRIADAECIPKSVPSSRADEANSSFKLPRLTSCSGPDEPAGDFLSLSVGSNTSHTPSSPPPLPSHELLAVGRVQQEASAAAFTSSAQSIYHAAAASSGFSPQQRFSFPKAGLNLMSSSYNPSLVIKSPVTEFLLASFNQPINPKQ